MAAALAAGGSDAALAPQAQEPQVERAGGAKGARGDWARDWYAFPDPLGAEALPLVMKVYGWLSWANLGTTRGLRNRPSAPPSPTGATAPGARRHRSPSLHTRGGAGDGRARRLWSQAGRTRGWERTGGAGDLPGRPGPRGPESPPHLPAVRTAGGHAPPPVGERAGATSTRTRATLEPH